MSLVLVKLLERENHVGIARITNALHSYIHMWAREHLVSPHCDNSKVRKVTYMRSLGCRSEVSILTQ